MPDGFRWPPRLDRRVCVTGVYDEINDLTTWTLPFVDGTINRIVLGEAHGDFAGIVLRPDWIEGNVVYFYDYDFSAGPAALGRLYPGSVELVKPYVRDRQGDADTDATITQRQLTATHYQTVGYELAAKYDRRSVLRRREFRATERSNGTLKGWFQGRSTDQRQFIISTTPRPFTVTSIEHVVDYEPRMSTE